MLVFYQFLSLITKYQVDYGRLSRVESCDRCVWILVSIGKLFIILLPKIENCWFWQWEFSLRFIWTRPYCNSVWGGGRLVKIVHIAGWWVGHAFKSEMVSDTIWVGVLTILNDLNDFYLKMPFFTKNLPIFTKKL